MERLPIHLVYNIISFIPAYGVYATCLLSMKERLKNPKIKQLKNLIQDKVYQKFGLYLPFNDSGLGNLCKRFFRTPTKTWLSTSSSVHNVTKKGVTTMLITLENYDDEYIILRLRDLSSGRLSLVYYSYHEFLTWA